MIPTAFPPPARPGAPVIARAALLALALATPAPAQQGAIETAPLAPLAAPAPLTPGGLRPPASDPTADPSLDPTAAPPAPPVAAEAPPRDPFAPLSGVATPGPGLNPLVLSEPLPVDDGTTPPAPVPGGTATPPTGGTTVAALPGPAPATRVDPRFRTAPPGLGPALPGGQAAPPGIAPQTEREVPPQLIAPIATALAPGATLRQLDKLSGHIETVELAAGAEVRLDRLRIRLAACRAPDDNGTHGTMAFVQIWDVRREPGPPAFSGWMFAESPALSALDHPRYDVWVLACTGGARPSAPSAPAPSPVADDDAPVTED